MAESKTVKSGVNPNYYVDENGTMLTKPEGWDLLPPGDAAVTKTLKSLGPTWTIQQKKGRKFFSKGVLAPKENIARAKEIVETKRSAPNYQQKLQSARKRRDKKQAEYIEDFYQSVFDFLNFSPKYSDYAKEFAKRVSAHATPVGSGTVARTERIPIEQRAERAVIAWMRHQTTAYDHMPIPRVKGMRKEIRSKLAAESRRLLQNYRKGLPISPGCPLKKVLELN